MRSLERWFDRQRVTALVAARDFQFLHMLRDPIYPPAMREVISLLSHLALRTDVRANTVTYQFDRTTWRELDEALSDLRN